MANGLFIAENLVAMHELFLPSKNVLFILGRMAQFPIIEKLGGRDAAYSKLKNAGFRRSADAMRMWWAPSRGVIPGDAVVLLMEIADREGVAYRAKDFQLAAEPGEDQAA